MRVRRWPFILIALVLWLFIAKHFLLDNPAAPRDTFRFDLDALHSAAVQGGPLPERIEVEQVGNFAFPRSLVVAGQGLHMHPMVLLVHRVVWPDRSVVIDSAMAPAAAQKLPGAHADAAAFGRVEKAMQRANAIVFTHEHADHVGGIAAQPVASPVLTRTKFTRDQYDSPKLERSEFTKGVLERLAPFEYSGLYALAPGVVLQKAPGHSSGSQIIYVELANHERFLFIGDIAWSKDNIRLQIGRPGIARLLMKEDRGAVAAQVKALAELPADVHVIVAHDPIALAEDLQRGLYRKGFAFGG